MHKEMAAWNWFGSMQLLSFHSCLFEYILAHGISGDQPVPAVLVGFELTAVQQPHPAREYLRILILFLLGCSIAFSEIIVKSRIFNCILSP